MPPALHPRSEVIERVMAVIRQNGYDGASISELSRATGLGKSSLYHHFPDGKDDMVRAVLDHLAAHLSQQVFGPLRGPGSPKRRIAGMVRSLDAFYRHGRESCVLAQLVLGSTRARFGSALTAVFREWIDAIASVLDDAGLPKAIARQRAEDAVLRIEGALVLAGGLDDASVFARTLQQLPATLFAPAPRSRH
jgi:TetR/AcrR family transcriptional repressor of lmrAB and yxaGH operons